MNTLRLTTLALGLMVSGIAAAQTYVVDRYPYGPSGESQ